MNEKCFRCGKALSDHYTVTIGGPPEAKFDDVGWHWINAAPHAASGGTMVPVCNRCDPPPVLIPRPQYEALRAAGENLAISADTAELFLRQTHPGHASSLHLKVSEWIKALAALRVAGIHEEGKP